MAFEDFVSDDEAEALILALGTAQESFTEDDASLILEWASMTRLENDLLDMVLEGTLLIKVQDGEPVFLTNPYDKEGH